jgi:hypothetical protein
MIYLFQNVHMKIKKKMDLIIFLSLTPTSTFNPWTLPLHLILTPSSDIKPLIFNCYTNLYRCLILYTGCNFPLFYQV